MREDQSTPRTHRGRLPLLLAVALVAVALLAACAAPESEQGTKPGTGPTTEPEQGTKSTSPEPNTEPTTEPEPELAALREGGFVIFLRHAETEFDDGDDPGHTEDFSDCSLQRNLNDAGREGARQQGEDLRALEVPVDEVLASPYCRTLQSAELTFGPEAVRVVEELATVRYLSRDDPEYEQRLELLREIFATPPPEGTNTVVMTHELNLRLVAEITVPQGGAVVFEPDAQGGEEFEIFATLPPEWWEREASGNAGTG